MFSNVKPLKHFAVQIDDIYALFVDYKSKVNTAGVILLSPSMDKVG